MYCPVVSHLSLQMIVPSQNICNGQCPLRSIDLPWTMQETSAALSYILSQQRAMAKNIWHSFPICVAIGGARGSLPPSHFVIQVLSWEAPQERSGLARLGRGSPRQVVGEVPAWTPNRSRSVSFAPSLHRKFYENPGFGMGGTIVKVWTCPAEVQHQGRWEQVVQKKLLG